ncbi:MULTISPECIES: TonB-dependent receptor [Methylotenera]|uniref:TonB-dependent receptor n=1 Tax=Methylotenera TaxID=359407 RepID=UPI0003721356|nr:MULTISPECIES: TonB-dependent receptor [Methylotenera]
MNPAPLNHLQANQPFLNPLQLKHLRIPTLIAYMCLALSAQAEPKSAVEIQSKPLDKALNSLAKQTGVQILFASEITANQKSTALKGNLSAKQALTQLLEGTNLIATEQANGTFIIVKAPEIKAETEADTLPEVAVNAKTDALSTYYAGGQVAREGRAGLLGNKDFMDTPFSATQYTSKLIEDQQAQNIGDILVNDPAVRNTYSRGSGRDEFNIRGFTLYNYDAMYNGLYGVAPRDSSSLIGIERIEVLRGPNALLNGMAPAGSVGGAINLVPKRAGANPLNRLTLSFIDDSQLAAHVDVARRFGAEQELGVRANIITSSGDTPVDNSKEKLDAFAIGIDFQGERFRIEGDLNYQNRLTHARSGLLFAGGGFDIGSAPDAKSNYLPKWTYWNSNQLSGTARVEFDLTPDWTVYGAAGGSQYDFSSLQTSWLLSNEQGNIRALPTRTKQYVNTFTGEVGVKGKFDTGALNHQSVLSVTNYAMEYGGLFVRSSAIFSNVYSPQASAKPNIAIGGNVPKSSESRLRSIALADTVSMLDNKVQLTLGARHQQVISSNFDADTGNRLDDHYDKSKLTPAVAFVIRPTTQLSFYGNYIEALNQGDRSPDDGSTSNPGQMFAPAVSKQREAGLKYDFGRFATTVSAFEIERPSGLINPTTLRYSMNGVQRNRGIELLTQGEAIDHVRVLGGLALTDGKLTKTENGFNDGNTAPAVPRLQFNLAGEWDIPALTGLTLTARMLHTSQQYVNAENTQKIPSWNRYDLGARYAFTSGNIPVNVRATIENLFDNDYWLSAARGGLTVGAPRTVLLSVSADF